MTYHYHPRTVACSCCGKPYQAGPASHRCPSCQRAFNSSERIRRNWERHHRDQPMPTETPARDKCQYAAAPTTLHIADYGLAPGDILEVIKDPDDSMIIGGRLGAGAVVGMARNGYLSDGAAFRAGERVLVVTGGELRMTP